MENTFKIRTYGRMELAQMYSPDLTSRSAWRKFKSWLYLSPGLMLHLYESGYKKGIRTFTAKQVEMIVNAIGEP